MKFAFIHAELVGDYPVACCCTVLRVSRSGYYFAIYLPQADGTGIIPDAGGGDWTNVDEDLAETTWCCYAWPANYNNSGNRSFFVNQTGDVTATDDSDYSGGGDAAGHPAVRQSGGGAERARGARRGGRALRPRGP